MSRRNTDNPSEVIKLCTKEKLFVSSKRPGSKREVTHYFMNGGKISIPDNLQGRFLTAYSNDLNKGEVHFIVENRTPIFRWMCDLDFYGPDEVTDDVLLSIVVTMQKVMKTFYDLGPFDDKLFDTIVLKTAPVEKMKDGKNKMKTGFHLYMHNLPVTAEQCLYMRLAIIAELELLHVDMAGWNSWENIVDEAVYDKNGLRLPGSHKSEKCTVCKNDKVKVKNCLPCGRKGYVDVGRVYDPYMYIRQTGEKALTKLANLKENTYMMVSFTCIRLPNPPKCPTWKRPEGAPIPSNIHSVGKGSVSSGKKKGFSEDQQRNAKISQKRNRAGFANLSET